MNLKNMAICIPTYNRYNVVDDVLEHSIRAYQSFGWDVYIYDSSTDNSTKDICERYMKKYNNLYYVKVDPLIASNLKVYNIYREFGQKKKYKYVWLCADYEIWSKDILDIINAESNDSYDMIVVNYRDVENIGTKEIFDYNELFVDCAWHMTLFGATIVKTETMLQDVPWNYLEKKYCIPKRLNFTHIGFYFEKICTLSYMKVKHLSVDTQSLKTSFYKKSSGWVQDTFYIWCDCWSDAIKALPDCYKDKDVVIKKHGVCSNTFSTKDFISFRESGVYTYSIYRIYKLEWKKFTEVKKEKLKCIAILPRKWAWIMMFKEFYPIKMKQKRAIRFCKKYDQIYIYGCGIRAMPYVQLLNNSEIQYAGFIVSNIDENSNKLFGKKVIELNDKILENKHIGILMGMNEKNTQEVLNQIEGKTKYQCGIFM